MFDASAYGVQESNPLLDGNAYHRRERENIDFENFVAMGGQFDRIRLLTERGYPLMDTSYIHGHIGDREYRVQPPSGYWQFPRRTYRSELANAVKNAGGTRQQQQQMWNAGIYSILWG